MLDHIVSDPEILGGKPIVKGTRISVEMILEWVASGATRDDILKSYPHLTAQVAVVVLVVVVMVMVVVAVVVVVVSN